MPPIALLATFVVVATATTAATAATGAAAPPAAGLADRSPYRHVRSTQPRTEQLLDLGARRSPTFARLRAILEAGEVIVYVQTVSNLSSNLEGRLVFLTTASQKRYLRIDIRGSLPLNDLLAAIGHELQHAVEIAGAVDVRDARSMGRFYQRIGVSHRSQTGFDTDAAREAGSRVRSELLGA